MVDGGGCVGGGCLHERVGQGPHAEADDDDQRGDVLHGQDDVHGPSRLHEVVLAGRFHNQQGSYHHDDVHSGRRAVMIRTMHSQDSVQQHGAHSGRRTFTVGTTYSQDDVYKAVLR